MAPGTALSPVLALAGGAELELRIALLPPLSRGTHLDGPLLHARRLIKIWQVAAGDDVPLAQAFRLLDEEAVARAILRALYMSDKEYPNDGRHWRFPHLEDLLPELRERAWQVMLDGALVVEAFRGVRGSRRRAVLSTELPRLTPDWELSRLTLGKVDEFIGVRVRRAPAELVKKTWKNDKPSQAVVNDAIKEIAESYPSPAQLSASEIEEKVRGMPGLKAATRQQIRDAVTDCASHLRGRRGYRSKTKSPN